MKRLTDARIVPVVVAAGLLLIGVGVAATVAALDHPLRARVLPGNFAIDASARDPLDISSHNSPTVAVDPTNSNNLVVSNRIDTPLFSCALHVSDDGGATWQQTPIPIPKREEPKCYAPDIAFSPDGTLHMSFVTLKGRGNVPNSVWVVSSDDAGKTLTRPRKALGPLAFQVRIAADRARSGRLYLTWLQAEHTATLAFPEAGYPIMAARSDDGGRSWSEPRRVSPASMERVVAPSSEVGPDGRLHVAFVDLGDDRLDYEGGHEGLGGPPYDGFWRLVLARSDDGGESWAHTIAEPALVPTERFVVFIPPFPSIAADRDSERVYLSFHDGRLGDVDVWLWASGDGGATFGSAVRVNDTGAEDGSSQYLPQVDVAPNGRVDVVYYDRRNDPQNVMNEVSLQSSIDGGRSFIARRRLSEVPFDSRIGFGYERAMPTQGSRLGLLSTETRALAVWPDTRNSTKESKEQNLAGAVVAFSRPPPLSADARTALSLAAFGLTAAGAALTARWLWAALRARRRSRQEPAAT